MVNRNLLRQYDAPEGDLQQELDSVFDLGGADCDGQLGFFRIDL